MLGKVLADFSNDPLPDIGVERAPQVGKRVSIGSQQMELFYIHDQVSFSKSLALTALGLAKPRWVA
jgi:hypothetical protein